MTSTGLPFTTLPAMFASNVSEADIATTAPPDIPQTLPSIATTAAASTTAAVPVSPREATLAPLINDFSIRLCESLARRNNASNVFVSPFSVSTILSILLLGSRSTSYDQLKHGLGFDPIDSKNENPLEIHSKFQQLLEHHGLKKELLLSNLVYTNKAENSTENEITTKFQELARQFYGAKLEEADFGTEGGRVMTDVNSWVNESTKGLIDGILTSPPAPDAKVLLLNAIYFKGRWARPFNRDITKTGTFFNQGVTNSTADFMSAYHQDYQHARVNVSGEEVDVVEIPYEGSNKSMVILLPAEKTGLSRVLASNSVVQDVTRAVREVSKAHAIPVNLEIPKFKLEKEYDLNGHLSELEITDIFTPGVADLSGIDGTRNLYVSLVKHKAVVDVNEEGTEAAAVTSVEVKVLSFIQPVNFFADHPFLFLIRDTQTGLILFIGKIENL